MILILKEDTLPNYFKGQELINKLNALPKGTKGKPDQCGGDPEHWELNLGHLQTFREWWEREGTEYAAFFLCGYVIREAESIPGDGWGYDEYEVEVDRALSTLEYYGVLKAMGFLDPKDFKGKRRAWAGE